jgi:hypothetical protein
MPQRGQDENPRRRRLVPALVPLWGVSPPFQPVRDGWNGSILPMQGIGETPVNKNVMCVVQKTCVGRILGKPGFGEENRP